MVLKIDLKNLFYVTELKTRTKVFFFLTQWLELPHPTFFTLLFHSTSKIFTALEHLSVSNSITVISLKASNGRCKPPLCCTNQFQWLPSFWRVSKGINFFPFQFAASQFLQLLAKAKSAFGTSQAQGINCITPIPVCYFPPQNASVLRLADCHFPFLSEFVSTSWFVLIMIPKRTYSWVTPSNFWILLRLPHHPENGRCRSRYPLQATALGYDQASDRRCATLPYAGTRGEGGGGRTALDD